MILKIFCQLGLLTMLSIYDDSTAFQWPSILGYLSNITYDGDTIHCETVYNKEFLEVIPRLKTIADNVLTLMPASTELMITRQKPGSAKAIEKERVVKNYKMKMQSLQCTFGVIVQYLLARFKDLTGKIEVERDVVEKMSSQYLGYTTKMISLLYEGQTLPHSWLWVFHARLMTGTLAVSDNYLLEIDLSNFTQICWVNRYLPESSTQQPVNVETNSDTTTLLINNSIDNIEKYLADYGLELHSFRVEDIHLVTKQLKNGLFEGIDGQAIAWQSVNWKKTKFKTKCVESTLKPIHLPDQLFACNEYHKLIANVLLVVLLYRSWTHMYIYLAVSSNLASMGWYARWKMQSELTECSQSFVQRFVEAVNFLNNDDPIIWEIAKLLDDYYQPDLDKMQRLASKTLLSIKNTLIELNAMDVEDNLNKHSILSSPKRSISTTTMRENTVGLNNYFGNTIKNVLKSIDVFSINFYRKGNVSFSLTFYYNDEAMLDF